jgi:apolipoprotein N-acyltransferase
MEWVRSWFFTGFPWMNLGVSQVAWPLAGYAPILGEYGISYLLVLTAAACVYFIKAGSKARIITLLLIFSLWTTGHFLRQFEWTTETGEPFKVALVQGNVDQATKWDPDYRAQIISAYLELSRPHWDVDVMIWPETAISAFYHHVPEIIEVLEKLTDDTDTDMLVGIPYRDLATGDYYNSVLALGDKRAFYHKRHLVPFGEFIPLQELLSDLLDFMGLPMSGFSRGLSTQAPLSAGGFLVGLTVCYEIIFNGEVIQSLPAANYLVNVSNNTWFGDSSMPYQQLQMAQLRALETERYVLSATNNGVSAVVDHRGRIVSRSPQFEAHVQTAEIQARSGATPYVIYGNYPVIFFLSLLILVTLFRHSR